MGDHWRFCRDVLSVDVTWAISDWATGQLHLLCGLPLPRAVARLIRDHGWTYGPPEIIARSFGKLRGRLKGPGVGMRYRPGSVAWWAMAESLSNPEASRLFVFAGRCLGRRGCPYAIAGAWPGKWPNKACSHCYGGPRLRPVWIPAYHGDANIHVLGKLPVAVDVWVRPPSI